VTQAVASPETTATIAEYVARARAAQEVASLWDQTTVDEVVAAVGWAGFEESNARALAERAVADTGMGRADDKVAKIRRKTMGTMADLKGAVSVGVVGDDPATGITEYAKPVGVVAALIPSTNPEATPINKAMMILKGRNAVVLSPSPGGAGTCALAVEMVHSELAKLGAPLDLVQYLPQPSKELSYELMRQCDLAVVTGSQKNVRAAYRSGKPAIGVGMGNAVVVVASSADLTDAAAKIKASKVFDYATSCSSENALVIDESVYEAMLGELEAVGGYLLSAAETAALQSVMWIDGALSRDVIAQPPETIAARAGLGPAARDAEFFLVEPDGAGPEHPFSGEKLSVVLALYRYSGFDQAVEWVERILAYQGRGHSCGIHTADESQAGRLAEEIDVARVLVNQAHSTGNGGAFDNGLNFTLTMGAGTWAGNSISENLSYRHFLNSTRLARVIPADEPTEEGLWGDYWKRVGR
jgi:sulfoacetaldehyde dehydrogenase